MFDISYMAQPVDYITKSCECFRCQYTKHGIAFIVIVTKNPFSLCIFLLHHYSPSHLLAPFIIAVCLSVCLSLSVIQNADLQVMFKYSTNVKEFAILKQIQFFFVNINTRFHLLCSITRTITLASSSTQTKTFP